MNNKKNNLILIALLIGSFFFFVACAEKRDSKFETSYNYNSIEKVENTIYFYNPDNGYVKAMNLVSGLSKQLFIGKNLDFLKKVVYKSANGDKEIYIALNPKEKKIFLINDLNIREIELPYEYNDVVSSTESSILTLRNINNGEDTPLSYSPNNFSFLDLDDGNLEVKSHTVSAGGGTPVALYFSKTLKFKVNETIVEKKLMLIEYNTKAILLDIDEPTNFKVIPLTLQSSNKTLSFKKVIFENNLKDVNQIDSSEAIYILASGSKDLYNISVFLDDDQQINVSISENDIQEYASDAIFMVDEDDNGIILSYRQSSNDIYITNTISDKKISLSIGNSIESIQKISETKLLVIEKKTSSNISKIDILEINDVFNQKSKNLNTVKLTIPIDAVTFLEEQNYLLVQSFLETKTVLSFLNLDNFKIFDHYIAIPNIKAKFSINKNKLYLYGKKGVSYFVYSDLKDISETNLNFKLYEYDFSISDLLIIDDKVIIMNNELFNTYYGFFDLVSIDDSNDLKIENFNHFMIEGL